MRERGRANGVLFLGSRLGGMLSAPIALLLIARWGWRASFVAFGVLGVVWAAAWHMWYRDRPEDHPAMTAAELAWIRQDGDAGAGGHTPWRQLARFGNLYAICAMYFAFGYGLYFYFTWLPTYLIRVLGFSQFSGGLFAALPFLLAGIADLAGGLITDRLSRARGLRVGRCYLGFAAFLTGALFLVASTAIASSIVKAILIAFALASADLALGACWAVPLDVAPEHAGVITGCMNTLGNLGGLVGPLVVGLAVDRWGSWTFPFYITAAVYASGAVAWLFIDPTRKLEAQRAAHKRGTSNVEVKAAR
jgi:nitrate/nitrite transporter NarK